MALKNRSFVFVLMIGISVCFCALLAQEIPQPSPDKKASEVFKNVQVLKDVPSDQLIPAMQFITSSLGVHCEYCHVEKAFDKDDKKTKQTARKMMQMMLTIDANNFDGKQMVTCYSCHRGNPKPLAIPLIPETQPKLLNESEEKPEQSTNLPTAEAVLNKYAEAIGGAPAISKLRSLSEKGTFEAGGRQFPADLLRRSPDHIALITHWPNGDSVTEFDGHSGWSRLPGQPARPMLAAEVFASRMDADLQFALDWKNFFADLKLEKSIRIGDKDAMFVRGQRSGQPDVEMYFDAQSGLLLRTVRYSASPLGLNPTQTDYSDYRDLDGVKLPFLWTSATPTGRYSIQIQNAQANVPIPDTAFEKP